MGGVTRVKAIATFFFVLVVTMTVPAGAQGPEPVRDITMEGGVSVGIGARATEGSVLHPRRSGREESPSLDAGVVRTGSNGAGSSWCGRGFCGHQPQGRAAPGTCPVCGARSGRPGGHDRFVARDQCSRSWRSFQPRDLHFLGPRRRRSGGRGSHGAAVRFLRSTDLFSRYVRIFRHTFGIAPLRVYEAGKWSGSSCYRKLKHCSGPRARSRVGNWTCCRRSSADRHCSRGHGWDPVHFLGCT